MFIYSKYAIIAGAKPNLLCGCNKELNIYVFQSRI